MTEPMLQGAGKGRRFFVIVSRFNQPVTDSLAEAAHACLIQHGATSEAIRMVQVPGAWELPQAAKWILEGGQADGVIALGCVIRGETPHFEFVSMAATVGLEALAREYGVPLAFGLLTTDNGEQALARAGGAKGNKGEQAALAVLEMCNLAEEFRGKS
jgi:6,7-dimethyl-8-ribityllumazine synthase